jgi:hypothetical protein
MHYDCVSGGGGPNSSLISCRSFGPLASRPSASRNPSYRSPAFALAAVWLASGKDGVVASQKRDEQGHGLDRNAHVTFETLKIAVDPIEPLSGGRFLTFHQRSERGRRRWRPRRQAHGTAHAGRQNQPADASLTGPPKPHRLRRYWTLYKQSDHWLGDLSVGHEGPSDSTRLQRTGLIQSLLADGRSAPRHG